MLCLRGRETHSNIPNVTVHPQRDTDEDEHDDTAGILRAALVADALFTVTCL